MMAGKKKLVVLSAVLVVALSQIFSGHPNPQVLQQTVAPQQEEPQLLLNSLSTTDTRENLEGSAKPKIDMSHGGGDRGDDHNSPGQVQQQRQQQRLCSNEEILDGQWVQTTLKRPPYKPMSPRVRCLPPDAFSKPFDTWEWQPHNDCKLASLLLDNINKNSNSHPFFELFQRDDSVVRNSKINDTIAFIGDSLTLEHYAAMVHLLGDSARLPPKAIRHGRIRRYICDPTFSLIESSTQVGKSNINCVDLVFRTDYFLQNITQEVEMSMPSVIVLNRGAHYTTDKELLDTLQQYTLPALQQWDDKCRRANMKCLLIWRTTVPGHPQCETFTQPAASIADMEAWIRNTSIDTEEGSYRRGEYHWQDFQHQNELVTTKLFMHSPSNTYKVVGESHLDNVDDAYESWPSLLPYIDIEIMDSYRPNILRPDHHRSHMGDCLHSCSPGGGSDLNSHWLYHILLLWSQRQQ